jgi:uroporphyrinogen decarboxylase
MIRFRMPLPKPQPDIRRFLAAMRGQVVPDKVPLVEYLVDNAVMKPILEELVDRKWVDTSNTTEHTGGQMDLTRESRATIDAWLDNQIAFWYRLGYDFIRAEVSLPLPAAPLLAGDTAPGNEQANRAWQGLHDGPIRSWEDFEKYPWPQVTDKSFYIHRYICDHLPEGMGFVTCHAGGIYEHASRLLGYENLCLKLFDDPRLVQAVVERLGGLVGEYNSRLLELEGLSIIFQGEDLGFNTQTLLSPHDIRKYILPWHQRYAKMCHDRGIPYYIHSCGAVDEIMEDFIETVRVDGKHSFQDNVLPVQEAKRRWGDRICILGGVDVHKLASYDETSLRKYVRGIIDDCAPGGRFALGAGNSIPSYIPVENYLIMLDEARR